MEHKQYKAMAQELEAKNAKIQALEYDFRAMQKRITALETENTALKRELHALNNAANKTKDAEQIAELDTKISNFEAENISITGGNTNTSTQTNNQTHTKTRSLKYGRVSKIQQSNSNEALNARNKNGVQRMSGGDVVLNGSNTQMLLHESAFGRLRSKRKARPNNRMRRANTITSRNGEITMNTLYNDAAELTEYQRRQMEAINLEGWWKALKNDKVIYKKDGLLMEDKGNELVVSGEDLGMLARSSVELALKKGWRLEDIRVNGTDEFKKLLEDEIKRQQELQKEEEKNKLTLGDMVEKIDDAVDAVQKVEDIKDFVEANPVSGTTTLDDAVAFATRTTKQEHGIKKIILDEAKGAIKDFVETNPVSGGATLEDGWCQVEDGWWKALKNDKIVYKKDGLLMEDKGNELVVSGEDLVMLARASVTLADKKGWRFEDIKVNGTDEFRKEVEDEMEIYLYLKRYQEPQKEEEKNKLTLGDVVEKIDDAVDAVQKVEDIKEVLEGQKSGIDLALEGLEAMGKHEDDGVKKIILDEAKNAIKDYVGVNPVSGGATLDDAVAFVSKGAKTGFGLK
jgi:hypothetical protein